MEAQAPPDRHNVGQGEIQKLKSKKKKGQNKMADTKASRRGFGRKQDNNNEAANNENSQQEIINDSEGQTEMTEQNTENENVENTESVSDETSTDSEETTEETEEESAPDFDFEHPTQIDTGDEEFDELVNSIVNRYAKRGRKMQILAKELSASASSGDMTDITTYAEQEKAPQHVKSLLANLKEMEESFKKAQTDLRLAVFADQGISVLTPEEEEAKKNEFGKIREMALHGLDGADGVIASEYEEEIPEAISNLLTVMRAALPVMPGQKRVVKKGGTRRSGSHGKPRLNGGFVKVGDKQEDSFAPATRVINANLPQGETKAQPDDVIGAWIKAANVQTWQDVPAGEVTFDFKKQKVTVKKN